MSIRTTTRPAGAPSRERGMTLIELMIALVIVGGLLALVVPSIEAVSWANVKEAAGKLSGTIGYLYNHTAITG